MKMYMARRRWHLTHKVFLVLGGFMQLLVSKQNERIDVGDEVEIYFGKRIRVVESPVLLVSDDQVWGAL